MVVVYNCICFYSFVFQDIQFCFLVEAVETLFWVSECAIFFFSFWLFLVGIPCNIDSWVAFGLGCLSKLLLLLCLSELLLLLCWNGGGVQLHMFLFICFSGYTIFLYGWSCERPFFGCLNVLFSSFHFGFFWWVFPVTLIAELPLDWVALVNCYCYCCSALVNYCYCCAEMSYVCWNYS